MRGNSEHTYLVVFRVEDDVFIYVGRPACYFTSAIPFHELACNVGLILLHHARRKNNVRVIDRSEKVVGGVGSLGPVKTRAWMNPKNDGVHLSLDLVELCNGVAMGRGGWFLLVTLFMSYLMEEKAHTRATKIVG